MPIYEYKCTNCQHQFDVLQKIADEPIKTCPSCSKDMAVRLVSAVAFQLKGSGWYATDFKDKGKPEQKSSGSPATSTSSDTKVAEKKSPEPAASSTASSKGDSD